MEVYMEPFVNVILDAISQTDRAEEELKKLLIEEGRLDCLLLNWEVILPATTQAILSLQCTLTMEVFMTYIHIIGRWSRKSLWHSVALPRGQAISLAKTYRLLIPSEFAVVLVD